MILYEIAIFQNKLFLVEHLAMMYENLVLLLRRSIFLVWTEHAGVKVG